MTASLCACGQPSPDAVLCRACTGQLTAALKTAASIAPDLDDAIARLLRRGSGGRRSETEAPLPVDLAASDASAVLRFTLLTWCKLLESGPPPGGKPLPPQAYDDSATADMARWLISRMPKLRQHEHAATAYRDIRAVVARALAVIDRKPERAPAGQCESCGAQLLAELGADQVECGCGQVKINLQADRMNRAAKANQLNSATAIAGALTMMGTPVLASTIRTWATRGRLVKRGDRNGEPVYALVDVIMLCNQRDERKRGAAPRRARLPT